ncbi:hypothetical protein [Enterococcus larvae]|uniref:hypothetical protein n=1 Tax=Enterococcus larvae TaxID=2794352 RepID=UPI003F2A040A
MKTIEHFQSFIQQFSQSDEHKVFAVLKDKEQIVTELPDFIEAALQQNQTKEIGFLLDDSAFFPSFSLTDNLFICSSIKDRQRKSVLKEWAVLLELPMSIFSDSFDNLSTFQQVKLQLLQLILADKKKIILANDFSKLSVYEKQCLFPLLKELATKTSISFWLITDDQKIADSPYIDETIVA